MAKKDNKHHENLTDKKDEQLEKDRHVDGGDDRILTDDNGVKVTNTATSLRAGNRGPLLFEDFHFYRKQTAFNRERIPEKVVHARGFGVYGEFETYESLSHLTKAHFLQKKGQKTPVFTRFSTFQGNKGSKDTAVDIRGFAVKFYTEEGNYDSLSLQFPVFIVSDAMKFADVVHAAKPNPASDIPQATTGHDNFWDYVANNQESAHMVMWLMSMRGRPRSWRTMAGWPINTFRFINDKGKSTFVRFKWQPKLGVQSLLLDEANIIGGIDPDFHRNDIIQSIKMGAYPEYELGVQLIDEEDEFKYDFDILDDTKFWPEEKVPVKIIGKMTLNRLVDDYFSETEQSAFDPSSVVPGIAFSNDPVLQGRSFAYRDTELYRQNSANINDLPVNRPINETNTKQQNSYQRHAINQDEVRFNHNSLAENTPREATDQEGGYKYYPENVEGEKTTEVPSNSFEDYFSQPRMYWNSLTTVEQRDLLETLSFHLQKVQSKSVRQQNVDMFVNVDKEFATALAENIGVEPPKGSHVSVEESSDAVSIDKNMPTSPYTKKVAVVIGNEFDDKEVETVITMLKEKGVFVHLVSEKLGEVTGKKGMKVQVTDTFLTTHPTLFDSLYVVGGKSKNQEMFDNHVKEFLNSHYKYFKPIGLATTGDHYVESMSKENMIGVVFARDSKDFANEFVTAIGKARFWDRK
ncbi:catalase [Gracilibacillus halotolerans]|uniref:Catalase n=1 Tax=Gracilibacillus halotolerans TaxID=74386 RepID=A0A841RLV7_9BACI|nr:catalase [Gracilibacillus halotolerans]MBB6513479.1 catalase [Gracilibacillus halotolerans]